MNLMAMYLIPAKSRLLNNLNEYPSEADFIDQSIDVQLSILNHLSQSNASKVIFVLDACRVNPFNPDHRASGRPSGLSSVSAKPGGPDTFILFAAEPGRVALDGATNASNSPFTESFADAISQPGSSLEAVYRQVREQVKKNTREKQRPYQEGVLFSFMFRDALVSPGAGFGQARLLQTGWERSRYDIISDGNELLKQFLSKKSIDDIRKAAESGDAEAQYLLGIAHNSGTGVAKDPERTAHWLRRSATRGFSRAQFAYGQRLYWGWGEIIPNKKEGFEWWLVAAENGNASAMLEIGDTYLYGRDGVPKQDYNQAEKYYNQALSTGHVEAETSLGQLYGAKATKAKKEGDIKVFEQASQQKVALFQKAAQKSSSNAMYQLANLYHYGDYVKVDLQQAVQWYKKSTSTGNIDAATALANLYLDESKAGFGKPQPEEAAQYFRIALSLGSKTAGIELADLITKGKVTSKIPDEAIKLYEQAFANGSLRAASSLSDVYFKGEVVAKDLKKAEKYALKALSLQETVKPDSEDAYPMYVKAAAHNLLKLYTKEGLQPATPNLVNKLVAQVGPVDAGMKRLTVPISCGAVTSAFNIYVWDWGLDEPPTTAQFDWLQKARGCEVSKDIVESFQKLYKIARDNKVSFQELVLYALNNSSKKDSTGQK
jgi:uncharacterized protein